MRVCWMRNRQAGVFYQVNATIRGVIRRWRTNAEPLVNR